MLNCSGRSVVGRSFLQPLSEKRRKKKNVIGVGFRKTEFLLLFTEAVYNSNY